MNIAKKGGRRSKLIQIQLAFHFKVACVVAVSSNKTFEAVFQNTYSKTKKYETKHES